MGKIHTMKIKKSENLKLTDQLREIVENCGITRYRISKETGISEQTLSMLMSGERFISPKNLDILGEYLGLEIRVVIKKPSKGRK